MEKVSRKKAKATKRATKNLATRAMATEDPKDGSGGEGDKEKDGKKGKDKKDKDGDQEGENPNESPQERATGFSRKTPISKKARSHPDAANSAMPKKTGKLMNTWNHFIRLLAATALLAGLGTSASGQASSRLSSIFLARGEQALLEITVVAPLAGGLPEIPLPKIRNVAIQQSGRSPQGNRLSGTTLEYSFAYIISSYEVGKYVIPPISVKVGGIENLTEPLISRSSIRTTCNGRKSEAGGRTIRYASSFRVLNHKAV